jgi:hypothetical protein
VTRTEKLVLVAAALFVVYLLVQAGKAQAATRAARP